jgi:hypothetical protein
LSSEAAIPAPLAGEARWIASGLYAALVTAAVCIPAWPGMMSYDSLFAFTEGKTGVTTALWPPMHAYLFFLSQRLGAGAGGLFLLQTFLLFFSGAVALNLLVRSLGWALAGMAAFALAFLYVPELIGALVVHWRDVTTTSFALGGLAAWLAAARYRSRGALILAAASFAMAAALRYNAILLIVLVAPLMVWRPFLDAPTPPRARAVTGAALIVGLMLASATTHWRLPDFKGLENPGNFGGAQQFDLIGISACADKVYLPPPMTSGWPITPKQIRMAYDPRHLQMASRPVPGAPRIIETNAGGEMQKLWPLAVRKEFGCYLAHRTAVFVEQMGLARDGVFYPTELAIMENPYGLAPAHPGALAKLGAYISVRQAEIWRRPFWIYLLSPVAVAVLWWRRSGPRLLFLALLGGAFAYPALLFVAAPAADARYIFPSSVLCAFILAAGGAVVMDERRRRAIAELNRLLQNHEVEVAAD